MQNNEDRIAERTEGEEEKDDFRTFARRLTGQSLFKSSNSSNDSGSTSSSNMVKMLTGCPLIKGPMLPAAALEGFQQQYFYFYLLLLQQQQQQQQQQQHFNAQQLSAVSTAPEEVAPPTYLLPTDLFRDEVIFTKM